MMAVVMASNYFGGYLNLMLGVDAALTPKDIDVEFQPIVEYR